jgi:thiamine pyrophosphate-dependent acetolactate synthase large subunit-like protein
MARPACSRPTPAYDVDLPAIAQAAGIAVTGTVHDQIRLEAALPVIRAQPGPVFYDVKVRAEPLPFVLPPKDGAHLKDRFRTALLDAAAPRG